MRVTMSADLACPRCQAVPVEADALAMVERERRAELCQCRRCGFIGTFRSFVHVDPATILVDRARG